jgi:hypothetical protein
MKEVVPMEAQPGSPHDPPSRRKPGPFAAIRVSFALAWAVASGSGIPAWAATGALLPETRGPTRLEASLGFDGVVVPDRWAPLWIRSEGAPEAASIQVSRQADGGRELGREAFPAGDGQRMESPVFIAPELDTIKVRLMSGGSILAELKLDAHSKAFPGNLVLVCGLSLEARLAISAALMPVEPLRAVDMDPTALPSNGLDYDGIGAIAVSDPGPLLSPAQREALLAWIAGGGRLAVFSAKAGREGLVGSLGIEDPRECRRGETGLDEGEGKAIAFGLGAVVRDRRELSDRSGLDGGISWRRILALEPYVESTRVGASALERSAKDATAEGKPDSVAGKARLALIAAMAAWLLAVLAAALLGASRASPLVLASILSLGLTFAGAGTLDAAFMRGASVSSLALVMPDSGAVVVSTLVERGRPLPAFEWMDIRAGRGLDIEYAGLESGSFRFGSRRDDAWKHRTMRVGFSPASAEEDDLSFAALLGPSSLEGSTLPALVRGSYPRGGDEPPDLESAGPMAFALRGEDSAGAGAGESGVLWWERLPGGEWKKIAAQPDWLGAELPRIIDLREGLARGSKARSFLIGKGAAPFLGLRVAGGPVREIRWILPLAGGRPPSRGGG